MKKLLHFVILILATLILHSCITFRGEEDDFSATKYKAVVVSRTEMENSVKTLPPQTVKLSGKIYIKDHLMFINDVNKGFHVYDYSNPENPVKIGFIQILGATDLAVRNNVIYINQAIDLVTLTYNPSNNTIAITDRNKGVFPQKISPDGFSDDVAENKIIVDWKPKN